MGPRSPTGEFLTKLDIEVFVTAQAFSLVAKAGFSLVLVRLLIMVASLGAGHGLCGFFPPMAFCSSGSCGSWAPEHWLSSCGVVQAQLLHDTWDLPRPGITMSPGWQ